MALGDDIITRLGLDTRPFQAALRGARGAAESFSKGMAKSAKRWTGNILGTVGIVSIVNGFKSIIRSAQEAKKAGEEFGQGGWMSPKTIGALATVGDFFSKLSRDAKDFAGYVLGGFGRFSRFLGALSATGSFSEANKVLHQMEEAEKKEMAASREKEHADKRRLAVEKAKEESLRKQKDLLSQMKSAELDLASARAALGRKLTDRGKFTLEELATSQVRFSGRLGREQVAARDIMLWMQQAEELRLRGFGNESLKLMSRADELRRNLTNVVDADRFPFEVMEEAIAKSEEHLATLARAAQKEGIRIIPTNG